MLKNLCALSGLVPKLRFGNALAGQTLFGVRTGHAKPEFYGQARSQTGVWERGGVSPPYCFFDLLRFPVRSSGLVAELFSQFNPQIQ